MIEFTQFTAAFVVLVGFNRLMKGLKIREERFSPFYWDFGFWFLILFYGGYLLSIPVRYFRSH